MKHLQWALYFDEDGVHALNELGEGFLGNCPPLVQMNPGKVYRRAVREDLKVSFSSAEIRNKILDEVTD